MSETFEVEFEYTDTFGGQANYCWVKRERMEVPIDTSDRALVRRAKAFAGLTGVRCRTEHYGDMWDIRPYGSCTVLSIRIVY